MASVKRKIAKDETQNFILKSNLQSWSGQNPKTYFREQENKIAFFEHRKRDEKFASKRRDDYDIGGHPQTEINRLICFDFVTLTSKIRSGLICKKRSAKLHRIFLKEYVQSVRKLANFCLICWQAVECKKYFFDEGEIETPLEKKERLKFRKTVKANDGTNRKIHFIERSIGTYKPKGENAFFSEIYGCYLILNLSGEIANLYELTDFQTKLKFVETGKIKIQLNSKDNTCNCKK